MSLARVNDLKRSDRPGDLPKAIEIGEQEMRPFVSRGPASEPEGQSRRVQPDTRPTLDLAQQLPLALDMRAENLRGIEFNRIAEVLIIAPPLGDATIVECAERIGRPCDGMDSVGDRVDRVAGEHRTRNFFVPQGDAVDIPREDKSQPGHVQHAVAAPIGSQQGCGGRFAQDGSDEFGRELVLPGRDGRVRREDALTTDGLASLGRYAIGESTAGNLLEQSQDQQRGMPLVHVVSRDAIVTERPQHFEPTHAEDHFLAQAIVRIASVETIGQPPIPLGIPIEIGVEKVDGNDAPRGAAHRVSPGPNVDCPPFHRHGNAGIGRFELRFRIPFRGGLGLVSGGVEVLPEVPPAMQERDPDHRDALIGRGAERIPCQDAEPATVCRQVGFQADFHREIGNGGRGQREPPVEAISGWAST